MGLVGVSFFREGDVAQHECSVFLFCGIPLLSFFLFVPILLITSAITSQAAKKNEVTAYLLIQGIDFHDFGTTSNALNEVFPSVPKSSTAPMTIDR